MDILTTETTITSATVEISVIRIGNKQMTLAVFRQLPNGHAFRKTRTGDIAKNGEIWGYVVDPKTCEKYLLFVYKNVLYKSLSYHIPYTEEYTGVKEHFEMYLSLPTTKQIFIAI